MLWFKIVLLQMLVKGEEIMRLRFDIFYYDEIYDVLVGELGFLQDTFLTDDCIEIDEDDYEMVIEKFPHIEFEIIGD